MTQDPMRRLRASNPVPDLSPVTPIAMVMPGWEADDCDEAASVENPGVQPSAGRLNRARTLRVAEASRASGPRSLQPGLGLPRRRLRASIAPAAAIAVAVAVVAVVLTVGYSHHGASAPGGQRSRRDVPGVAAARAQLLGELGALRRGHAPELAAPVRMQILSVLSEELAPNVTRTLPASRLRIDRSLVRIVRAHGYTVTLVPVSYALRGSASAQHTTGLAMTVRGPRARSGFPAIGNDGSYMFDPPVSPASIARRGHIDVDYVSGALNQAIVIVPDGVTRVQLSRFVPARSSGGRVAAIAPASARVHDNVAVISLPNVTTTTLHQTQRTLHNGGLYSSHHCRANAALYFVPVSMRMIWSRKTDTGSETRAATVRTDLDAYSTTVLPRVPCRRSPDR